MNCPRGKRNAKGAAKQASEIQSTDKSLERQNNLNSQEKPETSQGGKRVGSTYQSPECLEHSVCTTNSGTGKATLRPIDAFLSSRPGVGVERVAEVLKGGQSKDRGLSPYENMSHCMGLPCMSDRRPLSSFLMKDVYAHLGRPFSPTAAPIPTYPATPSLRPSEFTPLSAMRNMLTALHASSLVGGQSKVSRNEFRRTQFEKQASPLTPHISLLEIL